MLLLSGIGLLAGCSGIPVEVKLPDNLSQLIDDVNAIVTKLSSISLPIGTASWLDKMKAAAKAISQSKVLADVKGFVADFSTAWAELEPYIVKAAPKVVTAINTVLPIVLKVAGLVSMFAAQRPTGMTLAEARVLLHS